MHFTENHESYKEATEDLSHEDRKRFDNFLMGSLWGECKPGVFRECLKTAAICVADYVRPKS